MEVFVDCRNFRGAEGFGFWSRTSCALPSARLRGFGASLRRLHRNMLASSHVVLFSEAALVQIPQRPNKKILSAIANRIFMGGAPSMGVIYVVKVHESP
jgi:hypothetical protein